MIHQETESYRDRLTTALAINRGIHFVSNFKPSSHVTQTQWGSYLEDLYRRVYGFLMADTTTVSPQQRLIGLISSTQKAYDIGRTFHEFAHDFFDPNGFFYSTDRAANARKLAGLYLKLEKEAPFPSHNSLTLRVLFTAMGRMRGFMEKVDGIDFRRLSNAEVEILASPRKTLDDLTQVFISAVDAARDPVYPSHIQPHQYWDDRSVSIHGKRFIRVTAQDTPLDLSRSALADESFIVLTNGLVVPEPRFRFLLEAHMGEGHLLGALRIPREDCPGKLAELGTDIRGEVITKKDMVDYIDVRKGAPPICMNLHPMSMLTQAQHNRLEQYLKSEFKAVPTDLADPVLAKAVRESVRHYPRAEQMLDIAVGRLMHIVHSLKESIEEELVKNKAAQVQNGQAELVMTMGGSGSGKGSNQYFNQRYRKPDGSISEKYVYTSLDDGRPYSDIYHVLVAARHHADDYEAVHVACGVSARWHATAARKRAVPHAALARSN
jgi:hypothetical protein